MTPLHALARRHLPRWLEGLLQRHAEHPGFVLLVALLGLACTVTFSFPFSLILISATLLAPRRWLALSLASAVGAGLGAAILTEVFHHLGWAQVVARWPELAQDPWLGRMQPWLARWGVLALGLVAASPLPQTPALALCALASPAPGGVFAVVALAKAAKYAAIAWLSRRALPLRLHPPEAAQAGPGSRCSLR